MKVSTISSIDSIWQSPSTRQSAYLVGLAAVFGRQGKPYDNYGADDYAEDWCLWRVGWISSS